MLGLEGCIATIEANMFRTSMFILADVSALLTSYNVQLYRFSLAFVFCFFACSMHFSTALLFYWMFQRFQTRLHSSVLVIKHWQNKTLPRKFDFVYLIDLFTKITHTHPSETELTETDCCQRPLSDWLCVWLSCRCHVLYHVSIRPIVSIMVTTVWCQYRGIIRWNTSLGRKWQTLEYSQTLHTIGTFRKRPRK